MRPHHLSDLSRRRTTGIAAAILCLLLAAACAPFGPLASSEAVSPQSAAPETAAPSPAVALRVRVDGETQELTTTATTLGEALTDAGIELNAADEVDPPLNFEMQQSPADAPIEVTIARITETSEVIPESIPFERRIVRSADLSPEDPPRILQTGLPGLQEVTVRIVYRDGLEVERWPTAVTVLEAPVDEIVMVGANAGRDSMSLSGRLAYINDGRAIILENDTDTPRQLALDGALDGRVFQLSPDGRYLLYTITPAGAEGQTFSNELWVIATDAGAQARPLQIQNVLWAAWDPAALEPPRIAYTTARSVALPPGWEAINDLWLLSLPEADAQPAPVRILETYPATLGWWGGNYRWSPDGGRLAYAYADEIGLIDLANVGSESNAEESAPSAPTRTPLHAFDVYDTGADWAWLPSLSWSADGRYLAFSAYSAEVEQFDLWLSDTLSDTQAVVAEGAGIWSASEWSPAAALPQSRLASLRAVDPAQSEESSYLLWLSDSDGSNARRVFPPEGESGRFDRTNLSLAWGPNGNLVAFIFDDALHIVNLDGGELYRTAADDTISSHPTWSPYGAAATP